MKKSLLSIALTSVLATSAFVSTSASATDIEGLSTNVGLVSQYFFRGIAQTSSASASAGVDYEKEGFYVGAWTADVELGLEIDIYGGYGGELDNGLGYSVGFTTYQYTENDFDTEYNEINLGASYDIFSFEYTIGTRDGAGAPDTDYTFLAVTAEYENFYATYGTFGKDSDGDYIELGYGTEVSGFDVGLAFIFNSEELHADWTTEPAGNEESLVFSIGKSF